MAGRYAKGHCKKCSQLVWLTSGGAAGTAEAAMCRRCQLGLPPLEPAVCGICFEGINDRVRLRNSSNHSWDGFRCQHLRHGGFCRDCLRAHTAFRLEEGLWNVRCPGERCPYVLLESDLKGILNKPEDRTMLDRYERLRSAEHGEHLKSILRLLLHGAADSDSSDTAEPSDSSAGSVFSDASESDPSEHPEAEATGASPAPAPALAPEPSQLQRARAEEGEGFEQWAAGCCQACPVCLVVVRKDTGCNHMVCHCGTEFCFGCGAPYNQMLGPRCVCREMANESLKLGFWLRMFGKIEIESCAAMTPQS